MSTRLRAVPEPSPYGDEGPSSGSGGPPTSLPVGQARSSGRVEVAPDRTVDDLRSARSGEGTSARGVSPHRRVAAAPPDRTVDLSPEDFDRAVTLWGWCRTGRIDLKTLSRELSYLECGAPLCESCRVRSGTINDGGFRTCASCFNGGRPMTMDAAARKARARQAAQKRWEGSTPEDRRAGTAVARAAFLATNPDFAEMGRRRWAAEKGEPMAGHGSSSRYQRGCRCEPCVSGNRQRNRKAVSSP
jgi:hypothetical protein